MIFLKAIIMVLTAVSSLEFTFPAQGEVVSRAQQNVVAHWNEDYPIPDIPTYTLGICSSNLCSATNKQIRTEDEYVVLGLEEYFPQNGNFRFCVFLPGVIVPVTEAAALYTGPLFEIAD